LRGKQGCNVGEQEASDPGLGGHRLTQIFTDVAESICAQPFMHAQFAFDIWHDACYSRTTMSTETTTGIASYRLPLVVERVDGCYQATSLALQVLLVLADSLEEVLALAPGVARALLEAIQAKGVPPPLPLEQVQFPTQVEILVPA
jgi:hypothetical protein